MATFEAQKHAVYWDNGGVLTKDTWSQWNEGVMDAIGLLGPDRLQYRSLIQQSYNDYLSTGKKLDPQLALAFTELSGLDLELPQSSDSPFVVVLNEVARPNTDSIAVVQELKELGVAQGLASNTLDLFTKHVRMSSGVDRYLDHDLIVRSNEVGTKKPEDTFYAEMTRRTDARGIPRKGVIFVDNQAKFGPPAIRAGIQFVHYNMEEHSANHLRKQLRRNGIPV